MPTLYVVEQGARLAIERQRLVVSSASGDQMAQVPLAHTTAVVLFGNACLTTPAMKRLLRAGIDVIFLTRRGRYVGRLVGPLSRYGLLRQRQYEGARQAAFCLPIAQAIIRAKCLNMRTLLMRYQRNTAHPDLAAAIERLGRLADRAPYAPTHRTLRGIEGSGSATYFGVLPHLFKRHWPFQRRMRRPPPDPVNVLLSLGYTLLTRELEAAVALVGLDPYIGVMHSTEYGRPSLALDLVEEFRAIVVDSVVLRCLNNDLITPEDFTPGQDPARPVILSDEGTRRLLRAFEDRVQTTIRHPVTGEQMTYRRAFEIQTRLLARCFLDGEPVYRPFLVR